MLAAALAALALAAPVPAIHAHRGGPTLDGVHSFGEDTLPAFRHAWLVEGAVIELDAKITADGVAVVFHDPTLERTTPCEGLITRKTLAELAACPVDVLGSPGAELGGIPAPRPEPIARLADVLAFARDSGATLNLEIKNNPTEADFDVTSAFAERVMDAVVASAMPAERLIVQSFWPPNLEVARARMPAAALSLLTQAGATTDAGPLVAAATDIEWVSPQWPVSADFVAQAHGLGRRVVPYTLNRPEHVQAAAAAGVDAVITDDPAMARRALGLPPAAAPAGAAPVVRLNAPLLASDVATRPRVRIRWSGGATAYTLQARPLAGGAWRTLAGETAARSHVMAGRRGEALALRLRGRDAAGRFSAFARAEVVFPRDLRLRRGWRSARARGAWGGRVTIARRGARATLRFRGRRAWLVAPRSRRAGRLEVVLDGRRRVVSLRGRPAARRRVFTSGRLTRGRHTLRLRALGGGPVALDAFAVAQ